MATNQKMPLKVKRRERAQYSSGEDIIAKINEVGDELALLFGGVNYYTGSGFR
jgi:kynureninase